jgi:hypothetical protein
MVLHKVYQVRDNNSIYMIWKCYGEERYKLIVLAVNEYGIIADYWLNESTKYKCSNKVANEILQDTIK